MPIDPAMIEVGKCYRTRSNQVRFVEGIENGKVLFRFRGPTAKANWTTKGKAPAAMEISKFANTALHECARSWDPNYPGS